MRYFAYGSNLFTAWLCERAPSARPLGVGRLPGHALRWHKRSHLDGSGKCDAWKTSRDEDYVLGVIYEVTPDDKERLGQVEGVDHGYSEKTVSIGFNGTALTAFFYVVAPSSVDASLYPFTWYKALVAAGAREHRLPQLYLKGIERQPAVKDQDGAQAARVAALLGLPPDEM